MLTRKLSLSAAALFVAPEQYCEACKPVILIAGIVVTHLLSSSRRFSNIAVWLVTTILCSRMPMATPVLAWWVVSIIVSSLVLSELAVVAASVVASLVLS